VIVYVRHALVSLLVLWKCFPHSVLWYACVQFAGGLDPETLCAFEEIRQQVPGHFGGSRALLAGIKSS
jgi:hypothetical protein